MSRIIRFAGFALVACFVLSFSAAAQPQPQTIKGWGTVIDPDTNCRFTHDKASLTFIIPNVAHDLTYSGDFIKLNAPRVLQDTKGDFTMEVLVHAYPRPAPKTSSNDRFSFVSAGLLIWLDDKNFLRFERAAESNSLFAYTERFKDGKTASRKQKKVEDSATSLRLERKGKSLTLWTKEAGAPDQKWTEFHKDEIDWPQKLQVGVHALNTTLKEFAPQLENFKLTVTPS